jgi:hypothetical protein
VPDAGGRERDERDEDRCDDGDGDAAEGNRAPRASPAPEPDQREREEHRRPELRADRDAREHGRGRDPLVEQRGEREDRECGGPVVEARQHDRPEEERRSRDDPERDELVRRRRSERAQREHTGSAAGGYSSRKSRYGTAPSATASPYSSYTGVSTISDRFGVVWCVSDQKTRRKQTARASADAARVTRR